jgi:hypothetical protein
MLTLQHYTAAGWMTLGAPYALADAARVQQSATMLSAATGAVWRVLGEGGRVLSLWDGRRWQAVAEAQPMPASWWTQDHTGYADTVQTR